MPQVCHKRDTMAIERLLETESKLHWRIQLAHSITFPRAQRHPISKTPVSLACPVSQKGLPADQQQRLTHQCPTYLYFTYKFKTSTVSQITVEHASRQFLAG
ncbi:hypothetical protein [Kamptonema formosum]|uniref:hypothetical protein n=1 Tax=Kamptonema formosum TaxID=331992 RepID=UPI0005C48658|nr:hypothetical protein [Oscillatoria sp. PCC 10802]